MSAITLLEAARLAANGGMTKKAGYLMTFAEKSPLLAAIPFVDIDGNAYQWTRSASLPSAGFRAVNTSYTPSNGESEQPVARLKIVGGEIDVDNFIVKTGGATARTTHEMLKATAIAQSVGYHIIKGSITTLGGATATPQAWDGLQAQYGGGFGSTAVSTTGPNGAQVIANTGASDALSMAKLDETILAVDNPTHILLPKKLSIHIKTLLNNSAAISQTRDDFGRLVMTYNGLPMLWADVNGDTAGLAFNENNDSTTSLYVLNLSASGVHMVQSRGGMEVTDLGQIDASPVWRTRMEWNIGLVPGEGPRDVARLYNIADLTAVA